MLLLRSKLKRFVGVNVLVMLLLSLGTSIAHQSVPDVSSQPVVFIQAIGNVSSAVGSHSLACDICVGVVFLVLLVGRKIFLKNRIWTLGVTNQLSHWRAFSFTRPPNLKFALTLPQLGVFRI